MWPLEIELIRRYRYDKDSGQFFYREDGSLVTNKPSGNGYIYLHVPSQQAGLLAHRVAWFFVHGYWPSMLDHKDRCKTNNALANLRDTTNRENAKNNDALGVSFCKQTRKWEAYVYSNYRKKRLGRYKTFEEARAAREAAL